MIYITKFPATYRDRTWWTSKRRAELFVDYVRERYGVRGQVIKVREVKKRKQKTKQKEKNR